MYIYYYILYIYIIIYVVIYSGPYNHDWVNTSIHCQEFELQFIGCEPAQWTQKVYLKDVFF